MSLQDSLVDEIEDIVAEGVDVLNEVMADIVQALGDRPFGFAKVPREQLLDWYLDLRDSPEAWTDLIAEEAQFWGPSLGLRRVLKEAIQMEAMLERAGGPEAVRAQATMRRLGVAQKALQKLERHEALPKFTVAPPTVAPSMEELIFSPDLSAATAPTGFEG